MKWPGLHIITIYACVYGEGGMYVSMPFFEELVIKLIFT